MQFHWTAKIPEWNTSASRDPRAGCHSWVIIINGNFYSATNYLFMGSLALKELQEQVVSLEQLPIGTGCQNPLQLHWKTLEQDAKVKQTCTEECKRRMPKSGTAALQGVRTGDAKYRYSCTEECKHRMPKSNSHSEGCKNRMLQLSRVVLKGVRSGCWSGLWLHWRM